MTFAAFTQTAPEKPMKAPDRIYNWLNSQFSVARFYGGMVFQGHRYVIDQTTAGAPLVKQTVLIAERKAAKEVIKVSKIAVVPQEESLF
jgi:hypothetical protein